MDPRRAPSKNFDVCYVVQGHVPATFASLPNFGQVDSAPSTMYVNSTYVVHDEAAVWLIASQEWATAAVGPIIKWNSTSSR
jgi:hypothetical protein